MGFVFGYMVPDLWKSLPVVVTCAMFLFMLAALIWNDQLYFFQQMIITNIYLGIIVLSGTYVGKSCFKWINNGDNHDKESK